MGSLKMGQISISPPPRRQLTPDGIVLIYNSAFVFVKISEGQKAAGRLVSILQ